MRTLITFALLIALQGCHSALAPETQKEAESTKSHPAPADESSHLPSANRVRTEVIPDHLLGQSFMPGGTVGHYKTKRGEYRLFLSRLADGQQAAFLLLDWNKALSNPVYLAHMGGYFGDLKGEPTYVFVKGRWVAGVSGLSQDKADPIARELAQRLVP